MVRTNKLTNYLSVGKRQLLIPILKNKKDTFSRKVLRIASGKSMKKPIHTTIIYIDGFHIPILTNNNHTTNINSHKQTRLLTRPDDRRF